MEDKKIRFKNMTYTELCDFFVQMGEKKFRAAQVFKNMYRGVYDFGDMTELSRDLRTKLEESAELASVKLLRRQESAVDGTKKYLFEVAGGSAVESVFMKYKYGNTACISSQAGCRMGCAFCASTVNGLERNLNAGEIVDQVIAMQADSGRIGHIVVMGTGEPFDNYDELVRSINILHDEKGFNIGLRNITVSTCGILEKIYRFARDLSQVNLAVSLHAPSDEIRRRIMPIADSYTISELMSVCREYTEATHRRITFEYALIKNINDSLENAGELAGVVKGMLCHINLIPLNTVDEKDYRGSARKHAAQFAKVLSDAGIEVTVRRELGSDISAACGQLRLSESKK